MKLKWINLLAARRPDPPCDCLPHEYSPWTSTIVFVVRQNGIFDQIHEPRAQ
jgi:hypothetical protein